MTIAVTTVANTQSFGAWLSTTNRLANIVSQNTVTVDTSTGGSLSTGNGYVNGHFGAKYLYVTNGLSGGNVSSNDVLDIVSNVAFKYSTSNLMTITANSSVTLANINVNTLNITVSNSAIFSGPVVFSNSINFSNSVNASSYTVGSSTIANSSGIYTTGTVNSAVFTTSGVTTNTTGIFPSSNTSGNSLGTALKRWYVYASTIDANGTIGNAGDVLFSNGSSLYWAPAAVTLTANSTDSQTFYFPMSNTTSSTWSNGVISNSKLYFVPSTGTLSATTFNSLSDASEKINVLPISNALSVITSIRGVEFNWKETGKKSSGVIAQEIEIILPHLVDTNQNGTKSVNYDGVIAYLIEAIKELKTQIK